MVVGEISQSIKLKQKKNSFFVLQKKIYEEKLDSKNLQQKKFNKKKNKLKYQTPKFVYI